MGVPIPIKNPCSVQKCKTTGLPCENGAVTGSTVCRMHGYHKKKEKPPKLPPKKRGPKPKSLPPTVLAPIETDIPPIVPVPALQGGYSLHAQTEDQEVYASVFGDLSFLHELAAMKMALARMAKRLHAAAEREDRPLPNDPDAKTLLLAMVQEEDGVYRPKDEVEEEMARLRSMAELLQKTGERAKDIRKSDPDETLINYAERVLKACIAAQEQATGKKITVAFQTLEMEQEIRVRSREFMRALLSWLPLILCADCKAHLAKEIAKRQKTTVAN